MRSLPVIAGLVAAACVLTACGGPRGLGSNRDFVRIVGSSTVYPFAAAVAEATTKRDGIKSPVIEATGTGAGMKLFCAGIGAAYPDIVNASRRIKASEYQDCATHGVKDIVEIQVGLDGIAFAEAAGGPNMALTAADMYKALAAAPFGQPNTAQTWADVNPRLPAIPILVYGPPSTSGTRDALAELILTKGCDTDPAMKALKSADPDKHKSVCTRVREDGAYVDAGENDNLVVQKISANPKAIGVFGFSFLEENSDKLKGIPMDGIAPSYRSISDFSYPGARPLYIYVKSAHLRAVKGIRSFAVEFTRAGGPDGYLKKRGMVIAPADVRNASAAVAAAMTPLNPAMLK